MAGVDVEGGKGRALNRDINMIPFIDLLMVTIAFLLITAVWVTFSRMNANAQLPGTEPGPITNEEKTLHLYMTDRDFTMVWRQGATVVNEERLTRRAFTSEAVQLSYPDLAEQLAHQWKRHGTHQDPSDTALDRCVLHTDNHVPFKEIVAVMDAVYSAKRDVRLSGRHKSVAAFNIGFSPH